MAVDWANLPGDLLVNCARRCESVQDMVMFSCVCTSWNGAYSIAKANFVPVMPWLIVPNSIKVRSSSKGGVHNPGKKISYRVELPETCGRFCWGCVDGWIFSLGVEMDIELFNPLTKNKISLPSAHTFSNLVFESVLLDYRAYWFEGGGGIDRVSLIRIPPDNELYVFVRYDEFHLAFARHGDSVWNELKIETEDERNSGKSGSSIIESVVGFSGEVLVLYENGKLASLINRDGFGADHFAVPRIITNDTVDCTPVEYVPGADDGPVSLIPPAFCDKQVRRLYLVESFGDLLVVVERMKDGWESDDDDGSEVLWVLRFEVFKVDSREKKWAKLNDLGDVALFVGGNASMAVRASSKYKCKPNYIYFIEEKIFPVNSKKYVAAVFDLSADVIKGVYVGGHQLYGSRSPFWLMPKLV